MKLNGELIFHIALSVIVAVCAVVVLIAINALLNRTQKKTGNDKSAAIILSFNNAVKLLILIFAIILILQINGVNITSLVTGLGIFSAVVGLALQDILKDVIMGIHIITDKFFTVGDAVSYDGIEGKIIQFTIRTTKIESFYDHSVLVICNRNLESIIRMSGDVNLDIPIDYKEDVRIVHTIMNSICEKAESYDCIESCKYLGTQSFEKSYVLYRLIFHTSPEQQNAVRRDILRLIQDEFNRNGISIPYERIDVFQVNE